MTSTYYILHDHIFIIFQIVIFPFKIQLNLFKYSNKSNKFQLKMESDEETIAAAIVVLLLVK